MAFWVYILRCANGSYYTGHTDNLDARVSQHKSGLVVGWTQTRLPVELVYSEAFPSREQALSSERQIKGWSRAKKEALIARDWERLSRLSRRGSKRGS